MQIPKQFKLGGVKIAIEIVDTIDDGDCFGKFLSVSQKILLAKKVKEGDNLVDVSSDSLNNTYCHELVHAFQAYYGCDYDEVQAQCIANLLIEYVNSVMY